MLHHVEQRLVKTLWYSMIQLFAIIGYPYRRSHSRFQTHAPILQSAAHVCVTDPPRAQAGQNRVRHGEPYNAICGHLCVMAILSPEIFHMTNLTPSILC